MTDRDFRLATGAAMPSPGFGTWRMGEDAAAEAREIEALLHAIDLGFRHFDTAEMYGEGGAERVLGKAMAARDRERLFVTSKVYPWNAGRRDMVAACEASLRRLGTERLDLYLLHWPGSVALEETMAAAEELLDAGKILAFGVSNFDAERFAAALGQGHGDLIAANQVMYNPSRRGIEYDLLPLMSARAIACIAYTPIEPARLAREPRFAALAEEIGLSVAGLAMAWAMTRSDAVPIPKSATLAHIDALWQAAGIELSEEQLARIDAIFPPPTSPQPLDII